MEQLHDPLGVPLDVHAQRHAAALEPGLRERRGHAAVAAGRAAPRASGGWAKRGEVSGVSLP